MCYFQEHHLEAAEHQTPYIVELPEESDVAPVETSEQEEPTMQEGENISKVKASLGAKMLKSIIHDLIVAGSYELCSC